MPVVQDDGALAPVYLAEHFQKLDVAVKADAPSGLYHLQGGQRFHRMADGGENIVVRPQMLGAQVVINAVFL